MVYTHGLVSLSIDSIGANITSFQYDGNHIFFPQQAVKEAGELKCRGGSHICFPNFGTNSALKLKLPQHGIIRNNTFSNFKERKVSKAQFIEKFGAIPLLTGKEIFESISYDFVYIPDINDNIIEFPFAFRMNSTVYFLENGFIQNVKIAHPNIIDYPNLPKKDIPIGLGFHPYFNFPHEHTVTNIWNKDNDYFVIERSKILKDIEEKMPNDHKIALTVKDGGHVEVQFGGLFTESEQSKIVLWKPEEVSPFICVEPIVADNKLFNTEKGVYLTSDQDSINAWMMITVEK